MSRPARNASAIAARLALGTLLCAAAGRTSPAGPALRLVETETIVLDLRPMTVEALEPPPEGRFTIRVPPDSEGGVQMRLRWPGPGETSLARVRAVPRPPRAGAARLLLLEAELQRPDGRTVSSSRELAFDETATALFELDRVSGRSLTVAVEAQVDRERTLVARPVVGIPVQLLLEVQWLDGSRGVPLESNRLHTFVGEPVSYSFRLGQAVAAESMRVELTPLRLYGELVRIEMDVSGTLPDGEEVRLLSRRQDWLASRGSPSSIDLSVGDPPRGFRFVVTPSF